jgi:phosphoadenosine phosphosulfate reductase
MSVQPETLIPPGIDEASAEEILRWSIDEFFPDIGVACSMQDALVVDLATKVEPRIEVFFLQTMFHFPETMETARRMKKRYSLNLIELEPEDGSAVYSRDGYDACCAARKVAPLEKYLGKKRAWITGIRRAESSSRQDAKAVEWDEHRGLIKVNPLVGWSDEEVDRYIREEHIIVNPLRARGYASIGCAPCTSRGEGREGRWAGTVKTECGIHSYEAPSRQRSDRMDATDGVSTP